MRLSLSGPELSALGADTRVTVWDLPSEKGEDGWLVRPHGDGLRIAVLDGVTPWQPRCPDGFNAGRWAVGVTAAALGGPGTIDTAFLAANTVLHDPSLQPTRRASSACAVAADVISWGGVFVAAGLGAGDCELWAGDRGTWTRRAGGDFLHPQWRAQLDRWRAENPGAPRDVRVAAEAVTIDDQQRWRSACLGRFERPHFEEVRATAEQLVFASDGANLCPEAFDDLDGWLNDQARERHDDITVVYIRRRR